MVGHSYATDVLAAEGDPECDDVSEESIGMKLAGFLLLIAGWGIVISTLPLLPSLTMRAAFVLAGMAVEFVGLGLVVRAHLVARE